MRQWEYKKIDLNHASFKTDDIDLLDDAGGEGWELVGIAGNSVAYLKRPIDDTAGAAESAAPQQPRRRAASSRKS